MKKIVALGAAAALVGGLFAGEPASNPSVVEFTGKASVEWGVDLDAGKTGFKNAEDASFKMKLFDTGTKETSGDGVWAELKIKIEDDDSVGPNGVNNGTPKWKKAAVDTAKLHFNNFYVGIRSGDTTTGNMDFQTAVHGGGTWYHPGRWLKDVGPSNYTQGIVAGYDDSNMTAEVDFRSYAKGQYTNSYAVAAEAKLKDSNEFVKGLAVGAGASYNLSNEYYTDSKAGSKAKQNRDFAYKPALLAKLMGEDVNGDGEVKDVAATDTTPAIEEEFSIPYDHMIGYSASLAYKFDIDDKYYIKPQAGMTGVLVTGNESGEDEIAGKKYSWSREWTGNVNTVAAGFLFGWGGAEDYGSTGLHYFGDDEARGLTPGASVMAYIPLATTYNGTSTYDGETGTVKATTHDAITALVIPSLYSGNLVENLKFAAYSEIGLFQSKQDKNPKEDGTKDKTVEYWGQAADPDNTTAMAFAAGFSYDIKADDLTITPKASFRYANATYGDNEETIKALIPGGKPFFHDLGIQKKKTEAGKTAFYDGDFFNLKASVDVAGLINNTTFYGVYESANLLNGTEYKAEAYPYGVYNVKLGTFNVGAKISF